MTSASWVSHNIAQITVHSPRIIWRFRCCYLYTIFGMQSPATLCVAPSSACMYELLHMMAWHVLTFRPHAWSSYMEGLFSVLLLILFRISFPRFFHSQFTCNVRVLRVRVRVRCFAGGCHVLLCNMCGFATHSVVLFFLLLLHLFSVSLSLPPQRCIRPL